MDPKSKIPEGASHHTDRETIERRFPQLVESLSFYGMHAGEEVTFLGMQPLPDGEPPIINVWSRGTAILGQPDVVRLRDFCDRWLAAEERWQVSYSIPVGGASTPPSEGEAAECASCGAPLVDGNLCAACAQDG